MNDSEVEIVIVEDNPNDAELVTRVLKKHGLADKSILLKDGVEALDFLFAEGSFAGRSVNGGPEGGPVGPEAPQSRWNRGAPPAQVR